MQFVDMRDMYRSIKVQRKCKRCRRTLYQFAALFENGKRKRVRLKCNDCGHEWWGRYLKEEWDDETSDL